MEDVEVFFEASEEVEAQIAAVIGRAGPEEMVMDACATSAQQSMTLTEGQWVVMRASMEMTANHANESLEHANDIDEMLTAMITSARAREVLDDFTHLLFEHSEPRIVPGPVDFEREVTITGPYNLLFVAAASLARTRAETEYVEDGAREVVQKAVTVVRSAWTSIKAQIQPLTPGFGEGLD